MLLEMNFLCSESCCSRTHWRDYISNLTEEHLNIPQKERENKDIQPSLLSLLPLIKQKNISE